MPKMHLLKRYASPAGNFAPGSTIQVDEAEAEALVAAGAAERIDAMPAFVAEAPKKESAKAKRETATDKGAENRETRDAAPEAPKKEEDAGQ